MAVRYGSLLVAVLGIIGGYATPLMLGSGEPNFVGLFSYMLVLGVGVLGISFRRDWRLLVWLSFVGNYALFFLAMQEFHRENFWEVMPFLVGFFVLFSTAIFIFNVMNRAKSTLLELLGLWANAGIFFATSYVLVRDTYGKQAEAAVTLATAAFFVAHVYLLLQRRVHDRELLLSFTALAAVFLSVTLPLVLSKHWITSSWAVQAVVMLWIAGKLNSRFLRALSYLLYMVVIGRFLPDRSARTVSFVGKRSTDAVMGFCHRHDRAGGDVRRAGGFPGPRLSIGAEPARRRAARRRSR